VSRTKGHDELLAAHNRPEKEMTAREIALRVLKAVEEKKAYANLALNQMLEKYRPGKLDRSFTTELVYGVVRYLNTLDWVLGKFIKRSLKEQTPWVRNILRLGAYQIMYMDRVPASAACNESAVLARKYGHPGSVGFVNGVLRNLARNLHSIEFPHIEKDPVAHISLRYAHPEWMVKRWLSEYGREETIKLCQANNKPAPNTIRTNTLKISRRQLASRLLEEGLDVSETRFAPEGLNIGGFYSLGSLGSFQEGLFQVQDESSMLAGHALSPEPGAKVLDACGGPGGKTTHLAQLMQNKGKILSVDIHGHKLGLVRESCRRLGIRIVETKEADVRELAASYEGWADFVLVDAPCSGLGVLRRRPDAKWRKDKLQLSKLCELQLSILEAAARCVKAGGVILYAVCTITPEETTEVASEFLNKSGNFIRESLAGYLPEELFTAKDTDRSNIMLLPHIHGTDGFFMARFKKRV